MKLFELFKTKAEKQVATAWVVLHTKDRVILGKRAPSAKNPNEWNFFGGHLDAGESAVEAACRELEEETGYKANPSRLAELTRIGQATYYTLRVSNTDSVTKTKEVSKVKAFKLTDLPDNLHAKTAQLFNALDVLLSKAA